MTKIACCVLLLLVFFYIGLFAQSPEGAMGTHPLPKVVGMKGETPIKVDVFPRIAMTSFPGKQTTFRFRWFIEPHKDNRRYSVAYSCGSEIHSSERDLDGDKAQKTFERYPDLTVTEPCVFTACVVRIVNKKPKTICDHQEVRIPEG